MFIEGLVGYMYIPAQKFHVITDDMVLMIWFWKLIAIQSYQSVQQLQPSLILAFCCIFSHYEQQRHSWLVLGDSVQGMVDEMSISKMLLQSRFHIWLTLCTHGLSVLHQHIRLMGACMKLHLKHWWSVCLQTQRDQDPINSTYLYKVWTTAGVFKLFSWRPKFQHQNLMRPKQKKSCN